MLKWGGLSERKGVYNPCKTTTFVIVRLALIFFTENFFEVE